jgi:hypothetical protein
VAAPTQISRLLLALNGRLTSALIDPIGPVGAPDPKESYMSVAPTQQTYQYREVDSLEEVNRLAAEEGFDLFQAVGLDGHLHFVLRRVRDSEIGRRVGFSGSAPRPLVD